MSVRDEETFDLLRRRTEAVSAVSALNARALKLTQAIAGTEMEILRIELAMDRAPTDRQLVQELQEAKERAEAMQAALADCDGEIGAAEETVATLDRSISAAKGG